MFRYNAQIIAVNGNTEFLRQSGKRFPGYNPDRIIVFLFHRGKDGIVIIMRPNTGGGHNHIECEHNVVGIQIFPVGPFDPLADLHGMLGKIIIGLGHTIRDFSELLAFDRIHLPHHGGHQLVNAKSHLRALHIGVELSRHICRRLCFDDKGFPAGSAYIRHCFSGRAGLASRHCRSGEQKQHGKNEYSGKILSEHRFHPPFHFD